MPTFRPSMLPILIFACSTWTAAAQDATYVQQKDVVYGEAHGVGLLMDVFVPTGDRNGRAVVDVISGAWYSDRGKIRDHERAQTFHILCRHGYTVFAIRPGSRTKFSVPEMLTHLSDGIRWVKNHAQEYSIAADQIGLMGASAGGHLACLAAVTAASGVDAEGNGSGSNPDARVQAVAVFFPPTDFLDWGGKKLDPRGNDDWSSLTRRLAFPQGATIGSDEEATEKLTKISPARLVTPQAPPFLLIHGDADPVVPLQQSERMLAALKQAGVPAELIVKPGGGHPWLTLHEEVEVLANWFDKKLGVGAVEREAGNSTSSE